MWGGGGGGGGEACVDMLEACAVAHPFLLVCSTRSLLPPSCHHAIKTYICVGVGMTMQMIMVIILTLAIHNHNSIVVSIPSLSSINLLSSLLL